MTPGGGSPWRNPRIVFVLLLVFLCGSAAGALSLRMWRPAAAKPAPSWKEGGKEISLQRFRKELTLDEQQSKEVELILDDFMMYYQTLQVQMDEVRASGKERILRILKDGQRVKFNRMMNDLQARQLR